MFLADGHPIPLTRRGRGPGLLLIHGWSASRRFFDPILPDLAERFHVAAPDLVSCGDAPKPSTDLDLEDFVNWTLRAADRAGMQKFSMVGHSMGAAVAVLAAHRRPDRVRSVILSNGLVQGPTALPPFFRKLIRFPFRQVALACRRVRPIRRLLSDDFSRIEAVSRESARDLMRGTYRCLNSSLDAILQTDLEPALRRLSVPVGILWCRDDDQLDGAQLEIQRRARPEAPVICLDSGGHCPMLEQPRRYSEALLRLLELAGPADSGS